MRVGVDARHLADDRGVAHYTSGILEALGRGFPDDEWHLFVPDLEASAVALAPGPTTVVHRHPLPGRLVFGAAAVLGRPRLDRLIGGDPDVIWVPAPAPLAVSSRVPLVLTVHDLSFERRREDFTAYERLYHRLARPRRLARRATRVVADSVSTREEIVARWAIPEQRIAVVAPGVGRLRRPVLEAELAAVRRRHRLPEDYLLFVGALEPRKAPDLLVRAHAVARARGLQASLVLAGRGRMAGRLAAPDVHLLGHVSNRDLDVLYVGARALVMPSWLEGFGLPPLEAAARGTPSVVSDLPVFHETLGDGALRFPVGDEQALADALVLIASDASLRDRLVAQARTAIAPLTWERTAEQLREVLAEACA
ncbi:MAG TPA: glycosyltransferase family 1 protein [Solirubrobacteraceae bacterium]|nr:glycosyltransferase family 1 protein [Solirubrobacteraceae bacterium]